MYGQAVMWRSMKPTYDSSIESIRGYISREVLLYLSLRENYSKLIPNLIQKLNSKPTSLINLIYLLMSLTFRREGKSSSLSLNNETMVQVLLDMPTCYFCHLCNFTALLCCGEFVCSGTYCFRFHSVGGTEEGAIGLMRKKGGCIFIWFICIQIKAELYFSADFFFHIY